LSNISDAPYLGEAAVLFAFTRMPVINAGAIEQVNLPASVYIGIFLFIALGCFVVLATIFRIRRIYKYNSKLSVRSARWIVSIWFALIIAAVIIWTISSVSIGLIILLTAQLIPFRQKKQSGTA
jgi:hypothetical protein